jgi:conserved domain protein
MKNKTMQELDEQYKNAREHTAVYEVDGVTYTVHSFCVGDKNINEVMERLAMQYALNENEAVTA